ncbi:MAG: hypothetical protein ICV52_14965 [Microcoleus sp. C1-bin4]|nr:hypothetical protein [Microcoleus sp. C1-bin4]
MLIPAAAVFILIIAVVKVGMSISPLWLGKGRVRSNESVSFKEICDRPWHQYNLRFEI